MRAFFILATTPATAARTVSAAAASCRPPSSTSGASGTGTFKHSGGTNSPSFLYVGYNSGGSGAYSLAGSGQLSAWVQAVGYSGSGSFTQSGGSNSITGGNGTFYLGDNAAGSGTYSLGGTGQMSVNGTAYIGYSGTGTFTQSGGSNTILSGGSLSLAYASSSSGTYNLNGGLLALDSLGRGLGAAAFNFNGGTLQANGAFSSSLPMNLGGSGGGATFDTAGFAVTLSGQLSGSGSLTKVDSGTLTLAGSNTCTGPTTIAQGKLVVDGWLTNSAVSVSGGTLGGTGNLTNVTVYAGGNLAPGDAPGTLSVNGNLILSAGAVMDYELDTPATSDMISSGSLALNGQRFSDFNFTWSGNFAPGIYPLIGFASSSGSLGANTSGTIDGYPATLAVQGNDVVVNVVPEPLTLALLGAVVVGLLGYAWRRVTRRGQWRRPGACPYCRPAPAACAVPPCSAARGSPSCSSPPAWPPCACASSSRERTAMIALSVKRGGKRFPGEKLIYRRGAGFGLICPP